MQSAETHPLAKMTGLGSDLPRPAAITEPGQGGKFAPDGRALRFPGNTIVCHVPPASDAYAALVEFQEALKASPFAHHFSFLPAPSFHMTLFEGVCMMESAGTPWPAGTNAAMGLAAVTKIMGARLDAVALPQAPRIRLLGPFLHSGLGLRVAGADPVAETLLRQARRDLRQALRLDPPGFDSYSFHISLAYLLDWLTPETAHEVDRVMTGLTDGFLRRVPKIALGLPEFCTFETMHHFEPVPGQGAGQARSRAAP